MQTINGKFVQNLPTTSGESQRGPWVRGGFVIEYGEEYPRKVAFTSFGEERVAQHQDIPSGILVQVKYVPESREFNDKWYTDLRVISVTPMVQGAVPPANPVAAPAPATPAASLSPTGFQAQPASPASVMPEDPENDLPF